MAKKQDKVTEEVDVPQEEESFVETPVKSEIDNVSIPSEIQIVRPMISAVEAKEAWTAYLELKKSFLDRSDYQDLKMFVAGKGMTSRPFIKKSGWRKLATAFNVSVQVLKEVRKEYPEMEYKDFKANKVTVKSGFVVEIIVRATAMNGRYMDGTGTCASNERNFAHLEHDIRATAETRAKNRAISDLIGGGEVSAEEMMQMEEQKSNTCPRDHTKLPQKTVATEGKNKGRPYVKCPSCPFFEWQDENA